MAEEKFNDTHRVDKPSPERRKDAAKRLDQALEKLRQDRQKSLIPETTDVLGYKEIKVDPNEKLPPKEEFKLTADDLTPALNYYEDNTAFDSLDITQQLETDTENIQQEILWKTESTRKRLRREKKELKRKEKEEKKRLRKEKKQREKQVENKKEEIAKEETVIQKEPVVVKKEEKKQKVKAPRKKRNIPWKWILLGGLVFSSLFGAYWYKTAIYDPNHVITDQQEQTYQKLVEYADEWDMLSETEKKELSDYREKYEALVPKQKEQINAYFLEHTKKSLTDIFKTLDSQEANTKTKEENTVKEIVSYLKGWQGYSRSEKLTIVDYKEAYLDMTAANQDKVNAAAKESSGYEFMALVNYYEPSTSTSTQSSQQSSDSQEDEQEVSSQSTTSQAQSEVAALQQTLSEYQNYGATLQQQLASTTDSAMAQQIQLEIAANNQMIQQYQLQISQYGSSDAYE